jgi:hypothetical protein
MTLIASYITKFGIIIASDSNLSDDKGNAGHGQKIFPIPHLNACLAYSGVYSINGISIDHWINEFISGSFYTISSIKGFTIQLHDRMNSEMRDYEMSEVSIIHIAGYQRVDSCSHVEHWHISNTKLNTEDGSYSPALDKFHYSNDFNSGSIPVHKLSLDIMESNPHKHIIYINGFPPGRISYMKLKNTLDHVLDSIWNKPEWKFNKPNNINEFSLIVELYFDFVSKLFPMSDYKALYIGGDIQTQVISVPQDLLKD